MTDRELLELAAKAIRFKWDEQAFDGTLMAGNAGWNPLTDDGDALRLAVKLEMQVSSGFRGRITVAVYLEHGMNALPFKTREVMRDDPYAATRRAIVRAAAEIGRNMK